MIAALIDSFSAGQKITPPPPYDSRKILFDCFSAGHKQNTAHYDMEKHIVDAMSLGFTPEDELVDLKTNITTII